MFCPECGGKAHTVFSRMDIPGENVRRRIWECNKCFLRFSTLEKVDAVGVSQRITYKKRLEAKKND